MALRPETNNGDFSVSERSVTVCVVLSTECSVMSWNSFYISTVMEWTTTEDYWPTLDQQFSLAEQKANNGLPWTLLLQKICLSVVIVSRTCNRLCLLYRNSAAYRKLAYRTVHHYRHPTTHDVLDDHPQSLILSLLLHAHSLPESQRQLWQQVGRSSRNPSIAFPIAFFLLLLPLPGPHMFNCNRDRLAEISQQSKTARQNLRRGRNLAASRTKTGYSKIYMVIMEPT